jgi:glycosyltransferase involved in cell wall biosynthesis
MATGLMGAWLTWRTGIPLIVEIATAPRLAALVERPQPAWKDRLKRLYSDINLHLSVLASKRTRLMYPSQLEGYPLLRGKAVSVFHEFVATSLVPAYRREEGQDPYILLVGAPWYLKGADVLVRAFRNLAPDYPTTRLKLIGHFAEDRGELERQIGGHPRIDVLKARPNPETLELMRGAEVIVLPSRCEGFGRVLLEGMAAGIPVIGTEAGAMPHVIRDGQDGFVTPVGDVEGLERRLRELLSNAELRREMGRRGYERAHGEFSDRSYVERFTEMIAATARP